MFLDLSIRIINDSQWGWILSVRLELCSTVELLSRRHYVCSIYGLFRYGHRSGKSSLLVSVLSIGELSRVLSRAKETNRSQLIHGEQDHPSLGPCYFAGTAPPVNMAAPLEPGPLTLRSRCPLPSVHLLPGKFPLMVDEHCLRC